MEEHKNIRTSLLSKMFPKEGEKVPEIRFKGFSGEWEEKSLNDISNRLDNLRIPIAENKRVAGKTPYYGANGIQGYVEGYTHSGENILIAEDGANNLNYYPIIYVDGSIWVNNHAHVITSKDINKYNNMFLSMALKTVNFEAIVTGSSRLKLTASKLIDIKVKIPKIEEQMKIGQLFYILETYILKEQERIDKMNLIKKTLLNKMFV